MPPHSLRLHCAVDRTYTAGISLRWDHVDLDHNVILFAGKTTTEGSLEPVPLTGLAHDVLLRWKKEQRG
jgi:integrase